MIDLTPAPSPAPRAARISRHALTELLLTLRNGEQLLLNLLIPVGVLVAGTLLGGRLELDPRLLPPSVIALAIWSASFTSLAISTAFERRYGVLERLAATPLTRGDLVAGKAIATVTLVAAQVAVLAVLALALGWRPVITPLGALVSIVSVPLAVLAFAGFALALAGRLRAEAVLGLANLVYLVAAAAGGLVLPLTAYPEAARPLLAILPFGALGEALRGAATPQPVLWPLAVLAIWAVLCCLLARKAFTWLS